MDTSVLNAKQMQVVNELSRNILLSASAGTGKTNTLIYRIAAIIDKKKALPEEILCLTFTNKACSEIKDRITKLLGKEALRIKIKTFHSFCYDIIKAEAKKNSDLFSDFTIFDETDCLEIVRDINVYNISASKALQYFIDLVKQYRAIYDYFTDNAAKDYKNVLTRLFAEKTAKISNICVTAQYCPDEKLKKIMRTNGATIVEKYNDQLADMHGLDFTDLIVKTYEFFQNEQIKKIWRQKYKYINIDEMQDTSQLEYEILSQLFTGNNILLCGDYFQTIYEWRGSAPHSILLKYKRDYAPVTIAFDENYRATKTLLQASYDCLKNLFGQSVEEIYKSTIKAVNENAGTKIAIKEAINAKEESAWIFSKIKQLNAKPLSNICILTRSNKYNERLSYYFNELNKNLPTEEKIDFILVDEFKFFRRQEIKDVTAFLKLLLNKYDSCSLKRILKKFAAGIGAQTVSAIQSSEYRKAGISLTDFIDKRTYQEDAADPFHLLLQAVEKEEIIVFDVESTGTDTSEDEIIQIAAIKLDQTGKMKEKFVHLLKPQKKVGTSYYVHGFSDEYLAKNGEAPEKVLAAFRKFSAGAVIVGHNVSYDISILRSQSARMGLPGPAFSTSYDTLDMFRRFYPNLQNHKLSFLSDYFSIEEKPTHNALDDVMATAALLKYIIEKDIIPTATTRKKYIEKHIDQFRWMAVKINELIENSFLLRPYELIAKIMNVTKIKEFYNKQPERINRIREFYLIAKYNDDSSTNPRDALAKLLKTTALSNNEMDRIISAVDRIPIITVHQAKGSEFAYVFLAGMQDGIFPSYLALKEGSLEEEKRLFYVAVTRAKNNLYLSWSRISEHGKKNTRSRFIETIPHEYRKDV
ncbi:3'-5' exonuclease [Pectinatus cerevisiiphilus]|uniref:DNA 3'-5' helicase n=1 Tax=Pectinatus cerevisiiphilus TaxID=86956 RepID=A0A4R3K9I2_9FIRM|nr:3'-5' exonuclease [Pectinatus cerevisiiphilus]TCS79696.1 DNA helicase-2/ATP-dependent DNA helicase PcrA [Pectinatus cerevisiiphilus]